MRQIKFRGRNIQNGKWIYGDSIKHTDNPVGGTKVADVLYIGNKIPKARKAGAMKWMPVDPEMVGQFTGLLDRNGKEIYEGDIVNLYCNYRGKKKRKAPKSECGVVVWSLCGLRIKTKDYPDAPWNHRLIQCSKQIEVIGNRFDNPDLLNG